MLDVYNLLNQMPCESHFESGIAVDEAIYGVEVLWRMLNGE